MGGNEADSWTESSWDLGEARTLNMVHSLAAPLLIELLLMS